MRRVLLLLLVLGMGCASPNPFRADHEAGLATADQRELELKQNLRGDRSWKEQETLMADVKSAFGVPSDADVNGPKRAKATP
jgi:hypothetical protein